MTGVRGFIGFALGALTGGVLAAVLLGAVALPSVGRSTVLAERLPTRALARVLLDRSTESLVADSREWMPAAWGVSFFDRPKPDGEFLCAVDVTWVSDRLVAGGSGGHGQPDVFVEQAFGVLGDPSEAPAAGRSARTRRSCAAYRDFQHLIRISRASDSPVRAVGLIDTARDHARAGQVSFPVTCLSRLDIHAGRPCDGAAFLRTVDLKRIRSIEAQTTDTAFDHYTHLDTLNLDGDAAGGQHPIQHTVRIVSRLDLSSRQAGPPPDKIVSISIESEAF